MKNECSLMNELKTKPAYVFLLAAVGNFGFRPASRAVCISFCNH